MWMTNGPECVFVGCPGSIHPGVILYIYTTNGRIGRNNIYRKETSLKHKETTLTHRHSLPL